MLKLKKKIESGAPIPIPFADEPINDEQMDLSKPEMQNIANGMTNTPMQNENQGDAPYIQYQFAPHNRPSSNQNLPPIVLELLESAMPPISSEQMNVLNYADPPMADENIQNMANKPLSEKPNIDQNMSNAEKPSQESTNSMQNMPNLSGSTQKPLMPVDSSINGHGLSKPPSKPFNSIFLYSTAPMFQTAYYNQYNSFIPYIPSAFGSPFPLNQNIPPQIYQKPMNFAPNTEKPNLTKNLIIKLGEF